MVLVHDGNVQLFKVASMGAFDNNGYVIADPKTREAYIVDVPDEIERLLEEARDFHVKAALVTHSHPDHIAGYGALKRLTDLAVAVHPADAERLPEPPAFALEHGADLFVGSQPIRLLHTPGHTPGGVCMVTDDCLISGDTLFPGGPGYTRSGEAFADLVRSITTRLLTLPEGHGIFPGHGADTTIADARREYEAFAAREHPAGLHGHVAWLTS